MEVSDEIISKSIDDYINRKIYVSLSLDDLQSLSDTEIEGAIIDHITECKVKDNYKKEYKIVKSLSKGMQNVYATWWLEAEVNNWGFNQYFYNSTGQFAEEARDWYAAMWAEKMAQIVDSAIQTLLSEQDLFIKTKKSWTLEAFSDSYKETKLGECDNKFYEIEKEISNLRLIYIRNNLWEFITENNWKIKTWWKFW
ncbi:MAG: hypothetical protein ACD_3C00001G0004 [uncultured bacterium (gcode 4)]|uniref:DNA mimic protein DMP19 C-terminal domain-containing protein n=1 Tax=uncultured bacterium (gcode 4) TaxID=1234023 RepID=K2G0T6_9BACT|nr:MAG: hypothetical protein ACD_3C00001G0004 [uncultured bacterium (gcode 4)]